MYWTEFNYRSGPQPDLTKIGTNTVTVLKNVLDPSIHKALKRYVNALKAEKDTAMYFDEQWQGRWTKNNDPIMCWAHDLLTPVIYSRLKVSVKPSYNFLSCYGVGGNVPKHKDRPQCKYTLDYMVDQSEGLKWELFVEGNPVLLEENDCVIYSGTDMLHWRNPLPDGHHASLIFFHYVDSTFRTGLE